MEQKRSRAYRRVKIKTPSGRVVIHYSPKRKAKASCSSCGAKLAGIKHGKGIAASKRNPSRPYAGVLCSSCMRTEIKNKMVR